MQANLEKEAKEDEETHEKMQCWCKTNGNEKAKSIEEAQSKALEVRVEELTATSSRLATEIAVAEARRRWCLVLPGEPGGATFELPSGE
eukprot:Skav235948  [mRNA]  locus=scaffold3392:113533:114673:- [translate_table: standard]